MAVDSGCNAGGTALEQAYEAIKEGRCDNAIVGSSYISLHPHISLQMFKAGNQILIIIHGFLFQGYLKIIIK